MPIFCTLTVKSIEKSIDWYKSLGFRSIFSIQDPATDKVTFAHLRREKYQDILLVKGIGDATANAGGMAITMQAWGDIDQLTENAKNLGARVIVEPYDTPWNTREVTFEDCDGYRITFSYPNQSMIEDITNKDAALLQSKTWEKK